MMFSDKPQYETIDSDIICTTITRVAKMRSAASCRNIVLSILYPERLDTREAVRWGPNNYAAS